MMWGYYYWPYYLTVASLLFLGPELIALFTNPADTLSDYCWHELGVQRAFMMSPHTVAWYCSLAGWLLFVVVISLHIWWRVQ